MRPEDIFLRSAGCFVILMTFCIALALGYGIRWFEDATTPYIDRRTAIRYGMETARAHCTEARYKYPVDCRHFRLSRLDEETSGWFLTFVSADARQEHSMFIDRKGEYDSTGGNYLDDRL